MTSWAPHNMNYNPEATPASSTSPSTTTLQSPESHAPQARAPAPAPEGQDVWQGHLKPAEIQIIVIGTLVLCKRLVAKQGCLTLQLLHALLLCTDSKKLRGCSCGCWPVQRLLFGSVPTSPMEKVSSKALSCCASCCLLVCHHVDVLVALYRCKATTAAVQVSCASAYRGIFCSFACPTRCAPTRDLPALTPAAPCQTHIADIVLRSLSILHFVLECVSHCH